LGWTFVINSPPLNDKEQVEEHDGNTIEHVMTRPRRCKLKILHRIRMLLILYQRSMGENMRRVKNQE
jgi:hypothetical protein